MAAMIAGLNLVLLGNMGAGKSASGNTILGRQAFESKKSFTSVTLDLAVESGTVYGRRVTVYDTPGLFNTKLSEEEIQKKYEEVLQKCKSGLCVFLLVMKADRFTEKERRTVEKIEALLGEERLKKTWILFTGRDELEDENMTIDEFIHLSEPLKRLVQKYEQRYHVFNNKKKEPNGQVQELLTKIYATHPDTIEKGARPKVVKKPKRIAESVRVIEFPHQYPEEHATVSAEEFFTVSFADEPETSRWISLLGKPSVGKSASGNTMEEERRQREEKQRQEEIERVRKETEERIREEFDGPPRFIQERLKEMRLGEEERRRQEEERLEEIERDFHHRMSRCRQRWRDGEVDEQRLVEIERVKRETEERVRAVCEGPLRFLLERLQSMRLRKEEERRVERHSRFMRFSHRLRLQRKEEEQRKEEIESIIKETEERVRAVCEGPLRFLLERLELMRKREEERRRRVEEQLEEFERDFHRLMSRQRHMEMEIHFIEMHFMEMQREQEEGHRLEKIKRVIKETEERVKAEFEAPLRFLLERLESMRQREEERRRRVEEQLEELGIVYSHRHMEMERKEEEQRLEEIERVMKETEERIKAEFEGPPRFLIERLESMKLREEERKIQMALRPILMRPREERKRQRQEEIEKVRKETEEKIRAEFEGTPRFLQERLKEMRRIEEESIRRLDEEEQEELKGVIYTQYSPRRHMAMRLKRKQLEEKRRQEEIERVIKETEERIRAEFKDPPR